MEKNFNTIRYFENEEVRVELIHEPIRDIWGVTVINDKHKSMIGYTKRGATVIYTRTVEKFRRYNHKTYKNKLDTTDYEVVDSYRNEDSNIEVQLLHCRKLQDWGVSVSSGRGPLLGFTKNGATLTFNRFIRMYSKEK
jgi:hypothetical protein